MSTVSPPPGSKTTAAENHAAAGNAGAAGRAKPGRGKFDKLIDERIGEACRALWWAELVRTMLRLVLSGLALLGLWLLVDHWVYSPGVAVRTLLAASVVIAAGIYLWIYVGPLLRSSVRPEYAARAMERDMPDLRQSLTSYVTLREIGRDPDLRSRVIRTVGSSTAARLQTYRDLPAEATGTMRWWIATAVALAVLAAYAVASPKNAFTSAARLAAPLASIDAPRRVSIDNVMPGDTEAIAGRAIEVSATVKGLRDGEEVRASWTLPRGDESTLLQYDTDLRAFRGQIDLSHSVAGIIPYRIEAGDAVAGPFELSVQDVPVVALQSVQYQPPSYTGLAPHTASSGAITAIDGTEVTLLAKTNRPVAKAKLEFNPRTIGDQIRATAGATEIAIAEDGTSLSVTFRLRSAYGRSAAVEPESYRIKVWDDAGQSNPEPIIYPIRVIADLPPEVAITLPTQTPSDVAIDAQQIIEVHAADPDFGLREVALEIRSGIDNIARPVMWAPKDASSETSATNRTPSRQSRGTRVLEFAFRPSRYDLQINDKVQVVAVATDNRRIEELPGVEPNVVRTDPIELKITPGDPNAPAETTSDSSSETGDSQSGANENSSAESDSSQSGGQQGKSGQQGSGATGNGEGQQQPGDSESGQGSSGGSSSESSAGEGSENQSSSGSGGQSNESSEAKRNNDPNGSAGGGDGESANSPNQGGQNQGAQDQGAQDQASQGGDPTNASSPNQGSQSEGSQSEAAQPSPSGDASSSPDPSSGSAADGAQGAQQAAGSDRPGDAANQPPRHDGETFERIKDYLDKKREQQTGSDQSNSGQGGDEPRSANDSETGQAASGSSDRNQDAGGSEGAQPSEGSQQASSQQESSQQNGSSQQGAKEDGSPQQGSPQDQQASDPDSSPSSAGDESAAGSESSNADETAGSESSGSQSPDSQTPERQQSEPQQGEGQQQGTESQSEGSSPEGPSPNGSTPEGLPAEDSGSSTNDSASNESRETDSNGAKPETGQSPSAESGQQGSNDQAAGAEQQAGDQGSQGSQGSGTEGGEQQQGSSGNEGRTPQTDNTDSANEGSPADGRPNDDGASDGSRSDGSPSDGSQGDASSGESAGSSGDTAGSSSERGSSGDPRGSDQRQPGDQNASGNASGQSPGASTAGAEGRATSGDGQAAAGEAGGGGSSPPPAEPNLEYTREATDMVLDYLEETRDAPDRELLDELNWDEQDLKRFNERWQNLRETAKQPSSDSAATEEMQKALESLGLRPERGAAPTQTEKADTLRSLRDSGNRRPPPPAFRDAFDAFRRAVGQ